MLRGIVNRVVGALLLAAYIILVGGCGSGGQVAPTTAENATAKGIVLDRETGLPLADARVRIGSIIVHTDKAGAFVMVLPLGAQERSITAEGYSTLSDTVMIGAGENDLGTAYLFELPPPPPQF